MSNLTKKAEFIKIELVEVKSPEELKTLVTTEATVLQQLPATTEASRKQVYDAITQGKKILKYVDSERLKVTRLLDMKKAEIMEKQKTLVLPLNQILEVKEKEIAVVDAEIFRKQQEEKARLKKEQEEREEELRKKQQEEAQQAANQQPTFFDQLNAEMGGFAIDSDPIIRGSLGINPFTKPTTPIAPTKPAAHKGINSEWVHELIDLSKVPLEYLILNEAAVKAAIKKGVREIDGLKIKEQAKTRFQ